MYNSDAKSRSQAVAELLDSMRHEGDPLDISIADRRAGMSALSNANPPADDILVETTEVAGLSALSIRAPGSGGTLLMHVHGGGYVAGAAAQYVGLLGELSRHSGRSALSFDYRLAPEYPFPAAVDDALAVYRACLEHADDVAVLGDSAGGGLALAMLMAAREAGLTMPSRVALFSPWTDLAGNSNSLSSKAADDPMIDPRLVHSLAAEYVGTADANHPLVSPALGDFTGFPPLLIQVGSREVLLDDALAVDRAARLAGIDVSLQVWAEMMHVWQIFLLALPQAREAVELAGRWLAPVASRD